jgi:hypothetical protein
MYYSAACKGRREKINILLFLLPLESREGAILDIKITRNVKETEAAKEE